MLERVWYPGLAPKRSHWFCICDCGGAKVASSMVLTNGRTRSCGCVHDNYHRKHPNGTAAFLSLYRLYEVQAVGRGLCFDLSLEDFRGLTRRDCYYCGIAPEHIKRATGQQSGGTYTYNGIDRIDNGKGYTIDNCVPCCGTCNRMKMAMPHDEFLAHIDRIHRHRNAQ